ncbi:FCD domain-containing protein [Falsirhodobacter deserti]|uniref:FCD domain-containing protein n=1 Tax=Falsirhodobacter deserti TaxID=1365611 RepID=UPI0013E3D326|nr:FCD domain-containing protein [Falsirhodobacter deserti]
MEAAAEARDADVSFALDCAFHRLIFAVAGIEEAWHVLHGATGQLDRLRRWVFPSHPGLFAEALDEHRRILAALEAGDGAAAQAAMKGHLDDTVAVPARILAEDPGMIRMDAEDLQMFTSVIRSA